MKKFYSVVIAILIATSGFSQITCTDGFAGIYPCNKVDLVSHMSLDDILAGSYTNDIWGWVSPSTGKEYALVGCETGLSFVDLSDPVNPVFVGWLPTHTVPSLWRDVETYNNYAFIVSEASGHGLQVFDLSELDTATNFPVEFEETTHYDGFGHCHTVDINEESGYAYCNGTSTFNGGLHIVNIQNPLDPSLAGGFSDQGYTHDCHAVIYNGPDPDYVGHEIVVACNGSLIAVVDVTDKSDCFTVYADTYQGNGYCHQGWFTKGMTHFLADDELDEMDFDVNTRTHIFNMEDLDNVLHMGVYQSSIPSIDHNLYIIDNFVYESNYTSGVRILDAIKATQGILGEIAFFDLYPDTDDAVFTGTWSNYPFLPSGLLLATSMNDGFFVLQPNLITTDQDSWTTCGGLDIPINVTVHAQLNFPLEPQVEGLPGDVQVVSDSFTEAESLVVTLTNLESVPAGSYDFVLALTTLFAGQYEIPLHLEISAGAPTTPIPTAPADAQYFVNNENIIFSWEAQGEGGFYEIQISEDGSFTTLVDQQNVSETSYDPLFDLPEGLYYWRVRHVNECGESVYSDPLTFGIIVVGIDNREEGNTLIYPNPAADFLQYYSSDKQVTIKIKDVTGREVLNTNLPTGAGMIDVSGLAEGTYHLIDNSGVHKVLIQR